MMHDDKLRNIEYLREKADVSYEEAGDLLERYDDNVMRVLVELERQGRVYQQPGYAGGSHEKKQPEGARHDQKAGEKKGDVLSFLQKALQHRVVVEKGAGEEKETIANLSAPFIAGATVVAPHVAIGSVALMFALGYRVKIKKRPLGKMPGDVEDFVDRTVSNIKKTASSVSETVQDLSKKEEHQGKNDHDDHDDHDEGGEVTIE